MPTPKTPRAPRKSSSAAKASDSSATTGDADGDTARESATASSETSATVQDSPSPIAETPPPDKVFAEEPARPQSPAPAPARARLSASTVVLSALIAGGVAYATVTWLPRIAPELAPAAAPAQVDLGPVTAQIDALSGRFAALEERLDALPPAPEQPDLAPLRAELAQLQGRLASAEGMIGSTTATNAQVIARLETRVDELAAMRGVLPEGMSPEDLRRFTEEARDLRAALEASIGQGRDIAAEVEAQAAGTLERLRAAEEEVAALRATTERTASAADRAVALTALRAALDSGAPYGAAVERLGDTLPEDLRRHAATGVATMPQLLGAFPDAARGGLRESLRATVGEDVGSRLEAFLRNQVGARSTTPREGADPDAILSRAEAALREGDLDAALALIGQLPEEGRAAMAGWVARAEARQGALRALDAFAASGAN